MQMSLSSCWSEAPERAGTGLAALPSCPSLQPCHRKREQLETSHTCFTFLWGLTAKKAAALNSSSSEDFCACSSQSSRYNQLLLLFTIANLVFGHIFIPTTLFHKDFHPNLCCLTAPKFSTRKEQQSIPNPNRVAQNQNNPPALHFKGNYKSIQSSFYDIVVRVEEGKCEILILE